MVIYDPNSNQQEDEDGEIPCRYAVDIPKYNPEHDYQEYENVDIFATEKEAIKFCQENFGADEQGNINLITKF